jgi:rare lipoprotein A
MFDPTLDLASTRRPAPPSLQNQPAPQAAKSALAVILALSMLGAAMSPAVAATAPHAQPPNAKALNVHVDHSGKPQEGLASFYGTHAAGKTTASGLKLDPHRLTAASKTLPLGATAQVVNRDNGKTAKVVITDRGPAVKSRILDVSPKAAVKLGMKKTGVSPVKVVPLKTPPPKPLTRTARHQIASAVRRNG